MHSESEAAFISSAATTASSLTNLTRSTSNLTTTPLSRFTLSPSTTSYKKTHQNPHPHPTQNPLPTSHPPPTPHPSAPPRRILHWFHSDLRLTDNPSLTTALRHSNTPGGILIPFYAIHNQTHCHTISHAKAISDLRGLLKKNDSELVARECENVAGEILGICKEYGIEAVYWNWGERECDVGCQVGVEKVLKEGGVKVEGFWCGVVEREVCVKGRGDCGVVGKVVRRDGGVLEKEGGVGRLRSVPRGLVGGEVVRVGDGGFVEEGEKVLRGLKKEEEVLSVRLGGGVVGELKRFLDCGVLSGRGVAEMVRKIMGRYDGHTFNELVWRSCSCAMALCRSAGQKKVPTLAGNGV